MCYSHFALIFWSISSNETHNEFFTVVTFILCATSSVVNTADIRLLCPAIKCSWKLFVNVLSIVETNESVALTEGNIWEPKFQAAIHLCVCLLEIYCLCYLKYMLTLYLWQEDVWQDDEGSALSFPAKYLYLFIKIIDVKQHTNPTFSIGWDLNTFSLYYFWHSIRNHCLV